MCSWITLYSIEQSQCSHRLSSLSGAVWVYRQKKAEERRTEDREQSGYFRVTFLEKWSRETAPPIMGNEMTGELPW